MTEQEAFDIVYNKVCDVYKREGFMTKPDRYTVKATVQALGLLNEELPILREVRKRL